MAGSKQIVAPNGAFGYTAAAGGLFQVVSEVTSAEASTTIASGDLVMWGTTLGTVLQATTASVVSRCAGIAIEAIAPGATGLIVVYGYAKANCDAAAQFDVLEKSPTTAGRIKTVASNTTTGVGIALTAVASNVVDVWFTGAPGPAA